MFFPSPDYQQAGRIADASRQYLKLPASMVYAFGIDVEPQILRGDQKSRKEASFGAIATKC
jgi:hypothetical protein